MSSESNRDDQSKKANYYNKHLGEASSPGIELCDNVLVLLPKKRKLSEEIDCPGTKKSMPNVSSNKKCPVQILSRSNDQAQVKSENACYHHMDDQELLSDNFGEVINSDSRNLKFLSYPNSLESIVTSDILISPDEVARLCLEKFKQLPRRGKPSPDEWTMLAGIVLQDGCQGYVVSLATGTKSLGAEFYTPDLISDSHAEVLARRGLVAVLYAEMEAALGKGEEAGSILTKYSGEWHLRPGLHFHLFTSQTPCGDAAIVDSPEPLGPSTAAAGVSDIHRTGAPVAEGPPDPREPGAGYHVVGAVRHKPGRGPPSLSFSCSDKIARWIHCGLQGALLSRLIMGSVLLSSVTIAAGTPWATSAAARALLRPGPQHNVRLAVSCLEFPSARHPGSRSSPTALIWTYSSSKVVEVCVDGRKQGSTAKKPVALSICRRAFFKKFTKLSNSSNDSYLVAKQKAIDYQIKSNKFKQARGWPHKAPFNFSI